MCDRLTWSKKHCAAKEGKQINIPSARCGHTLSIVGSDLLLFGGLNESNTPATSSSPNNELFVLRLQKTTNNNEWTRLNTSNDNEETTPVGRWKHTATQISATETLIFGGYASTILTERLNDFWVFNAVTINWRKVHLNVNVSKDGDIPSPRGSHTSNVIGGTVYIFGGHGAKGDYKRSNMNDLYQLDLNKWTCRKVVPKGAPPKQRCGHGSCVVGTSLFIFGGWNDSERFHDMHVLSTTTATTSAIPNTTSGDYLTWTRIEDPNNNTGSFLAPRWDFVACPIDGRYIFIFGGVGDSPNAFSDNNVVSDGSTAYDEDGMDTISSTAYDYMGRYLNDVIVFDTTTSKFTDTTVEFFEAGGVTNTTNTILAGRSDAAGVYFEKESTILVYGGWANQFFPDLLTFDIKSLVCSNTGDL